MNTMNEAEKIWNDLPQNVKVGALQALARQFKSTLGNPPQDMLDLAEQHGACWVVEYILPDGRRHLHVDLGRSTKASIRRMYLKGNWSSDTNRYLEIERDGLSGFMPWGYKLGMQTGVGIPRTHHIRIGWVQARPGRDFPHRSGDHTGRGPGLIFRDLPLRNPQILGYVRDMFDLQADGEDTREVVEAILDMLVLFRKTEHVLSPDPKPYTN